MAIIRDPKHIFNEDGSPNLKTLNNILKEHEDGISRFNRLENYYNGLHDICDRQLTDEDRPNNKLVINFAEYITDFASSYFMGNSIEYTSETIDEIRQAFNDQHIHMVDTELSRDLSVFGKAYEYVYLSSDDIPMPKSTNIDPRNANVVVDNSVEYKTQIGIYLYESFNEDNNPDGKIVEVLTKDQIYKYHFSSEEFRMLDGYPIEHYFQKPPVIEYWNKPNQKGDFESVIPLIDSYNILQSDRVNDKEQFVQAILVLYGAIMGDTTEQKIATAKALKALGLLEMPLDSRAEYITKHLSESDVEILKDSIKNDIHKISKVPDMTDQNFASNSSGVAMKYKLMGIEQLAKTKEAYYKMSLIERLELYERIFQHKSVAVDSAGTKITMTRALPVNEYEVAQMVTMLSDTVSAETLLAQIPFVEDVSEELKSLNEQKVENVQRMQDTFGNFAFKRELGEMEEDEQADFRQ